MYRREISKDMIKAKTSLNQPMRAETQKSRETLAEIMSADLKPMIPVDKATNHVLKQFVTNHVLRP